MVQKKELIVRLKWNRRNKQWRLNQWRLNQHKKIKNKHHALLKLAMLPGTEGILSIIHNACDFDGIVLECLSLTEKERTAFISLCSL